jgi:hypothetical protein
LPYKPNLIGFFTNVNSLSKNLHPFWDWISKFFRNIGRFDLLLVKKKHFYALFCRKFQ